MYSSDGGISVFDMELYGIEGENTVGLASGETILDVVIDR